MFAGKRAHATPARFGVGQLARAANKSNLPMAERIQVFESVALAQIIVDDHRTDIVVLQFAAHGYGRNVVLLQIGENVDVHKQPVRENDQAFDAAVEQHFQIALEAAALVVHVGEDGEERRLVQSVFNTAQHERAVRVGHVENHDANGMAAAAAQRARKQVGTVAEVLCGFVDASFGGVGNVTGERRVVQDDGNGSGRKSAALGYVADGNCGRLRPFAGGVGG